MNEPTKPKLSTNKPKPCGPPEGYTPYPIDGVPQTPAMSKAARPGTTDGYVTPPVTFDDAD
jgi:hypothetical protein